MKTVTRLLASMVVGATLGGWAEAATLPSPASTALPGTSLIETTSLVTVATMNISRFEVSGPGTLHIALSDLLWPDVARSLSFSLSTPNAVLTSMSSQGVITYQLTGPATLFASVFAAPSASAGAALYNLRINFASAVPLPAAVWLLLSGMGAIFGIARRRQSQAVSNIACAA